jgi:imidazolonepropionase-like amidohydrolase
MAIRADGGLVVGWPTERPTRRRRRPDPELDEPDRARRTRERIAKAFDDARAYLAARDVDPSVPVDLRWEGMRPALAGERPVFFLANDYDQILGALAFAGRQGVKAVIVGGRDAHLCTDALRARDAAVIVDSVHSFPKRADSDFDAVYRLPGKLEAAGVRWCLASGDRTANERNLPYTAARAVAYGLAPDAALRAITLYPARILGVGDVLGSIEEGKAATLIVTDGDPLQVTTKVERAWIDGREIDLSNKQTKLYRKYREKYRQLGLIK